MVYIVLVLAVVNVVMEMKYNRVIDKYVLAMEYLMDDIVVANERLYSLHMINKELMERRSVDE